MKIFKISFFKKINDKEIRYQTEENVSYHTFLRLMKNQQVFLYTVDSEEYENVPYNLGTFEKNDSSSLVNHKGFKYEQRIDNYKIFRMLLKENEKKIGGIFNRIDWTPALRDCRITWSFGKPHKDAAF